MDAASLQPGDTIGHYVIERLVAVGGSAVVYQARDPKARRDVAVKLLRWGTATDPERERRLLHEARAYTRLVHPRIVTLYEVGDHCGHPFLVMEWVDGTTLAERLEKGALGPEECLRVMTQVADGLSAAHALGLAHRDVKPANIMLMPGGDARLLDFGLAKQVEASTSLPRSLVTTDGALLGTPAYMSPEQARGMALTLASDVFAFGAVLYEAITGTPAFGRASTLDTLNAVTEGRPVTMPRTRGRVAVGLVRLTRWCLSPNPDDRPRDARELVVELARLGRAGGARQAGGRRRWPDVLAAIALGAVTALAAWTFLGTKGGAPVPERGATVLAADGDIPVLRSDGSGVVYRSVDGHEIWMSPIGSGNPELVWAGHDEVSGLALAPDNRQVLFVTAEGGGPPWVWEVPLDGGLPRKVTRGFAPAVSPDGSWVAALVELSDRDRQLVTCRRDGTERRVIASFKSSVRPLSCAFAGAGDAVLVVLTDGVRWSRLVRVDREDGSIKIVTEVQGVAEEGLAVASRPAVAVWCLRTAHSTTHLLRVTDLRTGRTQPLYPGPGRASHPSVTADGAMLALDVRTREREIVEVPVDPVRGAPSSSFRVLRGTRGASQPRVSPDGTRMVFRSVRGDLSVLERATGSMGPLLTTGVSAFNPSWAPDGRQVAYACIEDGYSALWLAGADGSDPRPITRGSWNAYQPVWLPGGRHMLLISDRDGKEDLYIMAVPTGELVRLSFDGAVNPAAAADGRTVAYVVASKSDRGQLRLARLAANFRSLQPLWEHPVVINRWAGAKPRFSPDGRWLAFDQPSDPVGADVWVLPVIGPMTGLPRKLTEFEVPVSLVAWYDWSPTGELVLALTRDPDRMLLLQDAHIWVARALR